MRRRQVDVIKMQRLLHQNGRQLIPRPTAASRTPAVRAAAGRPPAGGPASFSGPRQFPNARRRRNRQRPRPARRVDDDHTADGVVVRPLPVPGANRQRRQQRRPRRAGVKRPVVGRRIQHPMKDAPHHIVAPPRQVPRQVQRLLPDDAHRPPPVVIRVRPQNPGNRRLKNRLVIQRQNRPPSLRQSLNNIAAPAAGSVAAPTAGSAGDADAPAAAASAAAGAADIADIAPADTDPADPQTLVGPHRRPLPGVGRPVRCPRVLLRPVGGRQMPIQPRVKHHRAGNHQSPAHRRRIIPGSLPAADRAIVLPGAAVLVAARLRRGRQIQTPRQALLLIKRQQLNRLPDLIRQPRRRQIGVPQLRRRQRHRRSQIPRRTLRPLRNPVVLIQNSVAQPRLRQRILIGIRRIANRNGGMTMPVVNPVEAVVHRVLLLPLALPHFGFNDDNMAAKPDAAVRPPAAFPLQRPLRPGAQPLPPQQNAQGGIEVLFVGAWHNQLPLRLPLRRPPIITRKTPAP